MKNILLKTAQIMAISAILTTVPQAAIVVIGHSSMANSLSIAQVKHIYLGKENTLPNGAPVEIVDISNGATIRDEFYEKVAKKNPSQLKAYRAKLVFSGNGSPPLELGNAGKVKVWVAEKPGRLGYIDSANVDGSVKVITTIN